MRTKRFASRVFAVVALAATASAMAAEGGTALILKAGSYTLSNEDQSISGIPLVFDDSSSGVFGVEFEWRQMGGVAFGLELTLFSNDWQSGFGTQGDNDTMALLFNAKKYFAPSTTIRPYIGAGIGFASADFDGPGGSGSGSDLALQGMAGVEFRGEKVGFYTEVKYLTSKPEDDYGDDIDVTGTGFFAGVSVMF